MLHKIIQSPISEPILQCVLNFMERLLEVACAYDPASASGPLRVEDLELEFGSDVTEWLTTNSPNVLEKLKVFARRLSVDKLNTLAQFKNDRAFTEHLSDPAYRFQIHQPAKTDDIKIWLVKFYDQLKSIDGFHPIVCNHHSHFNYKDWWDSFDEVVDLEFTVVDGGKELIQLHPNGANPDLPLRIQKYSELFAIPAQWNNNIHEITPIATRILKQLVSWMKKSGQVISKDSLKQIIDDICDDMEKDWGNAHYYYPASKWLRWAKENKFESLCKELGVA